MTATLKRKISGAHRDSAAPKMTALRALRLSVARASEELFGLALAVSGGRQAHMLPDELGSELSDNDLLVVLDCPGGMTGAAAFSLPMVAAVIQHQTTGRVSDRTAEPREYTDTDAALMSPLLEEVLRCASTLVEEDADVGCFQSIRFGARSHDARTLLLTLRAEKYRMFSLPVDIALGRHQATLTFVLPMDANSDESGQPEEQEPDARAVNSPFLDVETDLRAVLARFRLPVSELNELSVGDTLPLPRERLDDTALVTLTDKVVARGKLGQMNGHRAVRLMAPTAVPKVGHPAGFDPQITTQTDQGALGAAPTDPSQQLATPVLDLEVSELGSLSTDEAVDQISSLAGLTTEDLAAVDATLLSGAHGDVHLPAVFPGADADSESAT